MTRKAKCPGNRRCHLGGDIECINGVRIDVDVYMEGWERDVIYPPGPCHPKFCRACGGTGEAKLGHPTDDCPKCEGTGYRGGKCDAQERLAATLLGGVTSKQFVGKCPESREEENFVATKCPHCNGDGGGEAFINRGLDISTHSLEWVRCSTCEGDGVVSDVRAAFIVEGKKWRDARVKRQETLMEMSRRIGIGPAEISALEHGRGPPLAFDHFRTLLTKR